MMGVALAVGVVTLYVMAVLSRIARNKTEADAAVAAAREPQAVTRSRKVAELVEAGTIRCPVTGNALLPGRVFFGLGNDARAKSVVNGLLSKHPADRLIAEARLETWADPQVARDVAGLAEMRGLTKLSRVRDPFMEIMLEAAMRREAEAEAKAPRTRKAKDNAKAPVETLSAKDRAAVTRRRNLVTEAAELVRGLVDSEERKLFAQRLLDGGSDLPDVGWLRLALTPLDELSGTRRGQPEPRPAEAGTQGSAQAEGQGQGRGSGQGRA